MIKLQRILLAGAFLALATTTSMASGLPAGDVGGAAFGYVLDAAAGNDLLAAETITLTGSGFGLTNGHGSLIGVSGNTGSSVFTVANPTAFELAVPGFKFYNGSLTAYTSSSTTDKETQSRAFTLTGWVDLGGVLSTSQLVLTFSKAGTFFIATAALVVPAPTTPAVPEPSSVALAGIGLAAAGLFGLRKRLAK